jgi:hypothetical protein
MFKIQMGQKVKCCITGFEGIVTGRADYISGCRQYLVQPKGKKNEIANSLWLDEDRLIVNKVEDLKSLKERNDGGPQINPAPIR